MKKIIIILIFLAGIFITGICSFSNVANAYEEKHQRIWVGEDSCLMNIGSFFSDEFGMEKYDFFIGSGDIPQWVMRDMRHKDYRDYDYGYRYNRLDRFRFDRNFRGRSHNEDVRFSILFDKFSERRTRERSFQSIPYYYMDESPVVFEYVKPCKPESDDWFFFETPSSQSSQKTQHKTTPPQPEKEREILDRELQRDAVARILFELSADQYTNPPDTCLMKYVGELLSLEDSDKQGYDIKIVNSHGLPRFIQCLGEGGIVIKDETMEIGGRLREDVTFRHIESWFSMCFIP